MRFWVQKRFLCQKNLENIPTWFQRPSLKPTTTGLLGGGRMLIL